MISAYRTVTCSNEGRSASHIYRIILTLLYTPFGSDHYLTLDCDFGAIPERTIICTCYDIPCMTSSDQRRSNYDARDLLRIAALFVVVFTAGLFLLRNTDNAVQQAPDVGAAAPTTIRMEPTPSAPPAPPPPPPPVAKRLIIAFDSASLSYDLWRNVERVRDFTLNDDNELTVRYDVPYSRGSSAAEQWRDRIQTVDDFVMMLLDVDSILRREEIQEVVFVGAPHIEADTVAHIGDYLNMIVNKRTLADVIPNIQVLFHNEDDARADTMRNLVAVMNKVALNRNISVYRLPERRGGSSYQ